MAGNKSSKRVIWIVAILLLLGGAGWWAYKYLPGKAKELAVEKIKTYKIEKILITEGAFKKGDFVFAGTMKLDRPLPGADVIDIANTDVKARFASKLQSKVHIEPKGDLQTFGFSTRFDGNKFVDLIRYMQKKDSMYVVLSAVIPLHIPVIGDQQIRIDKDTLRWPTFKFPELKLGRPQVKKVGLRHSELSVPLYLHNLEDTRVDVAKAQFDFDLQPVGHVQLEPTPPIHLKPKGRDSVGLRARLKWQKPLKTFGDIIVNKDEYWADIHGTVDVYIRSDSSNVRIPIEIKDRQQIELLPGKEKRQEIKDLDLVRSKKK